MKKDKGDNNFDGGGNFFNKYESRNPVIQLLMRTFFSDFKSIINPIKDQIESALEIGCGEGYITEFLNQMEIPIIGTDASSRIIDVAKGKFPDRIFFVLSVYALDSVKKDYDLIVANEVFEHLDDPDRAIEEIKKISKKYIFISVPHEPYFRYANILRFKYIRSAGNTPGHVNRWSKKQFEKFLISHGLKITKIKCSTLWTLVLCEK
jgi:2-polyprenyl-3-methyl-5-hydroxy-6-metoxy-1,4-benzoquinol methylase